MPGVKEKKRPQQQLAQARRVTYALIGSEPEDRLWYERLSQICDNLEELRRQRPAEAAEWKLLGENVQKSLGHLAEETARAIDYIEMRDGSYSVNYAAVMGISWTELKQKQPGSAKYTYEFEQRHKNELAAWLARKPARLIADF